MVVPGHGAGGEGGGSNSGEVEARGRSFGAGRGSTLLKDERETCQLQDSYRHEIGLSVMRWRRLGRAMPAASLRPAGSFSPRQCHFSLPQSSWPIVWLLAPTLETLTAAFRSPLRARAGRRVDRASMIGKLYRSRRGGSRNHRMRALRMESISGSKRAQRERCDIFEKIHRSEMGRR